VVRAEERSHLREEDALGVSRPVTIKLLRAMREAGLIEWVGKSERDPSAYWQPHIE
jgi:predicted transcriptional regulator